MLKDFNLFIFILLNFLILKLINCVKFELGPCLLQYLEPCSEDIIQFYLFTSDRPNSAPILLNQMDPIVPKWIDLRKTNKLIVHGYGGNLDFHATKTIRNAYLAKNNTNVIIIDWGKLANLPCYPTASFNTKQAGDCSAMFLKNLYDKQKQSKKKFQLENLHMIGFSLGAHIIGFICNAIHKLLHIKINRITGLDPALPFFTTINRHWKLDKTDAKFVDVIHTNAGVYGKIEPCGHVDFYVNGGQSQPACIEHSNLPLCSHMLATIYFAESINSDGVGFWGLRCTNYFQYLIGACNVRSRYKKRKSILMGEYCSIKSSGIIFVDTNSEPPYALG